MPSSTIPESNKLFPVFLKLEELSVLIVGGGNVALEKINAVLQNSPLTKIRLIAVTINEAIRSIANDHPTIELIEDIYTPVYLNEVDLVVVAVNDQQVSEQVRTDARQRKLFVNVADNPGLCDFYLGSVVQKGNLKIAISTNGKSPTAAKRIKEVLHEALPGELNDVIENLHTIRNRLNGDFKYKVATLNRLTKGLVEKGNGGN